MPKACPERAKAVTLGLKFYTNGSPCVRGHTGPRYTHGSCVACTLDKGRRQRLATSKEDAAAYSSVWRSKNPEKCRQYQLKSNAKNWERITAYNLLPRVQESHRAAVRRYRALDIDRAREQGQKSDLNRRDTLSDSYIKRVLYQNFEFASINDIPEVMIEIKRLIVSTNRKLKDKS